MTRARDLADSADKDITGTLTVDGLTVDSDTATLTVKAFQPKITLDDDSAVGAGSDKLIIQSAAGQSDGDYEFVINNDQTSSADQTALKLYGNGDISFYDSTGVTQGFFWDASTQRLGLGTTIPARPLHMQTADNIIGLIESTDADAWLAFKDNTSTTDNAVRIGATGDDLRLYAGQAERLRIDSSGNVGIGTTSPGAELEIASTQPQIYLRDTDGGLCDVVNVAGHLFLRSDLNNTETNSHIRFDIDGSEKMRIHGVGGLSIGTSSVYQSAFITVQPDDTNRIINTRSFDTTSQYHLLFQNSSGTAVGNVFVSTTSTAFNTSSDYRLKTNVNYDWDATSRLKQLKPARFEWISDGDDAVPVDGFLAHEVSDIVPEAVTGTKDAMRDEEYEITPAVEATYDDEGNVLTEAVPAVMGTRSVPDYQGIDQSKLVPLLVKTIQELEARIAALEAN